MSRIGTVEQMNVVSVLQRIESVRKNGLLVIKQDTRWVEFYCREGRLLCVGPIRTDATLGERLLQDRLISSQALQETMHVIGSAVPSETRIALTLMDLGYVKREELRPGPQRRQKNFYEWFYHGLLAISISMRLQIHLQNVCLFRFQSLHCLHLFQLSTWRNRQRQRSNTLYKSM